MLKPAAYLRQAAAEMERSATWYERREEGLGARFDAAVREAEAFICRNPQLGTPHHRGTRKWRVAGFPHAVIYREESDRIIIFAVAHAKRRPGYWVRRAR